MIMLIIENGKIPEDGEYWKHDPTIRDCSG